MVTSTSKPSEALQNFDQTHASPTIKLWHSQLGGAVYLTPLAIHTQFVWDFPYFLTFRPSWTIFVASYVYYIVPLEIGMAMGYVFFCDFSIDQLNELEEWPMVSE